MTETSQHDDERIYCVVQDPVYCVPVDINPAVTIPSVFLKGARETLLPPGKRTRENRSLLPELNVRQPRLTPQSRLRKYSLHLKNIGYREKVLVVILTMFIVTFVSLITSVIFMFCNHHADIPQPTFHVETSRTDAILNSLKTISPYQPAHEENRSPCVGTCWTYSAFRFRSQCISGYCQCGGEFYNHLTCLPDVYGCTMESNVTEAQAFFNDLSQAVYTCSSTNKKEATNHVISTYGHHNSDTVNVDVRAASANDPPITLILANYYPTKWRLNVSQEINISKIILMSNDHVAYSSVEFHDDSKVPGVPPRLRIRRLSVPVGYGDDRNGAHTVDLLKYIIRHLGPIASFSGAHYADHWTVTMDRHETGVPYNNMV